MLLVAICYISFYLIKIQTNNSEYYVYTLSEHTEHSETCREKNIQFNNTIKLIRRNRYAI